VVGLNASLEYLNKINFYSYFEEENKMRNTLIERLKDIPSIQIYGIEKQINASSIVSFNIIDKNYNDISTFLDQYGIMIRGGQHCCQPFMKKMNIPGSCRASFGIYNDINDIDILVDSLEKTVKLLQ
jgi:cysteine desulfurase/selenocysteine lyase